MQMNSTVKTHRKTTNPFQNGAGIKKWPGEKDQKIGTINFECHAGSFHFFSSSSMKC
jgi:hypothetical protein